MSLATMKLYNLAFLKIRGLNLICALKLCVVSNSVVCMPMVISENTQQDVATAKFANTVNHGKENEVRPASVAPPPPAIEL